MLTGQYQVPARVVTGYVCSTVITTTYYVFKIFPRAKNRKMMPTWRLSLVVYKSITTVVPVQEVSTAARAKAHIFRRLHSMNHLIAKVGVEVNRIKRHGKLSDNSWKSRVPNYTGILRVRGIVQPWISRSPCTFSLLRVLYLFHEYKI